MAAVEEPQPPLDERTVAADPVDQFAAWFADALASVRQPEAMILATVDASGAPQARAVLMRGFDADGFVWHTNRDSAKARELALVPRAALVWHWRELNRQVRATGVVHLLDDEASDAYWCSRPRPSQLAAWASPQSEVLRGGSVELGGRLEEVTARFAAVDPVPRPPFWGGYRLAPDSVELWQGREARLHDRLRYRRAAPGASTWIIERLAPVNAATAVELAVAALFALGNWISRVNGSRALEYATKPTVTALLAVAAITLDARDGAARAWFVVALLLSLAGDVLLMLPREQFVPGLASFLLAHVAYIIGFVVGGTALGLRREIVVLLAFAPLGAVIVRAARRVDPSVARAVGFYVVVIATMVTSASASHWRLAFAGALLFAFSDSTIAVTRFVREAPFAPLLIMVTYHLGQTGLVLSLIK